MDIDTRRALGIYTRLNIPKGLADMITNSLLRLTYGKCFAHIKLGPLRRMFLDGIDVDYMYTLSRSFINCVVMKKLIVTYYVQHTSTDSNPLLNFFNEYEMPHFDKFDDVD